MEEEIAYLDKTIQNVYEMGKIYKSDSVLSAIENYYKLKSKYEMNKKAKCIFCGTDGFTIFKTINTNGNRTLIAECNSTNTCSKKIKILTGKIENFYEKISLLKQEIKQLKLKIILYKNDILFGYINPDSTDKFEKIMTEFDKHTLELKVFMDLYSDIITNIGDYEKLKKLESKLYTQIENIKINILNYNTDKNPEDLDEAVNIFVELLSKFSSQDIGLLDEIMLLKYVNPSVEYNEKEKTVRLIQIPKQYDIYSNEFSTLPIEVVINEKQSSSPKKAKTTTLKKKYEKSLKPKSIKTKAPKEEEPKISIAEPSFWGQYSDTEEDEDEDYVPLPKITIEENIGEINDEIIDLDKEKEDVIEKENIEEKEDFIEKEDIEEKEDVIEGEAVDEIYILIDKIPTIVEKGNLYDEEIEFIITTKTTDALPGKAKGEKIPTEQESKFEKLSKMKNWRYYLSNYGIGEFVLDGKTWKTVEHYYQASKFKKNNPQFYNVFSLDYREPVEEHPELIISENASLAKYAGTTGIYTDKEKGSIRIRPKEIEIDDDFFLPEDVKEKDKYKFREQYELFIAQQTKFTTNEKMKKILKATKNAKLKYNDNNNSANNIMYIRTELQ
jgi:predicted NAD-dependent protein-ADP-ribosyltransferase YbiA (DUF1768 family)